LLIQERNQPTYHKHYKPTQITSKGGSYQDHLDKVHKFTVLPRPLVLKVILVFLICKIPQRKTLRCLWLLKIKPFVF